MNRGCFSQSLPKIGLNTRSLANTFYESDKIFLLKNGLESDFSGPIYCTEAR